MQGLLGCSPAHGSYRPWALKSYFHRAISRAAQGSGPKNYFPIGSNEFWLCRKCLFFALALFWKVLDDNPVEA